jgi:hypothetical protein
MEKLLKNTGVRAPGAPVTPLIAGGSAGSSPLVSSSSSPLLASHLTAPLKKTMEAQKRNEMFTKRFRIPLSEVLHETVHVRCIRILEKDGQREEVTFRGRLYLSDGYIAFESTARQPSPQQNSSACWFTLPLFTIRKVERLNTGSYAYSLSLTTWHKMEIIFELEVNKLYPFYFHFAFLF